MTHGLLAIIGVGWLVGFRHAFEPDHLAAVTTLSTQGRGLGPGARLGVAWGVGHTASILAVAIVLKVLGINVPDAFYRTAELTVALLLIVLGLSTLWAERRLLDGTLLRAVLPHVHGPATHTHAPRTGARAFCFGVAHGLAGSGAVIVLLVAAATTQQRQFGYLMAFGLGSVLGMSLVSAVTGALSGAAGSRNAVWLVRLRVGAALVSTTAGVLLGWSVVRPG